MRGSWLTAFVLLGVCGCTEPKKERPPACPPEQKAEAAPVKPAEPTLPGVLRLVTAEGKVVTVPARELKQHFPLKKIVSQDPNYDAKKSFSAFPFAPILRKYFPEANLEETRMQLVASDGYSVEVEAKILLSESAHLAVGELNPGEFSPIGPRSVDPGPFYLVYEGDAFSDEKKFPRPWSLVTVEILDSADRYEHTRPEEGFGENALAQKGYDLFSVSCLRCHSVNREGGKLGPDLNVPQNILAYRPEDQVRAYIRDPRTFRYSSMPAHPHLSNEDVDAIVSYLKLMGEHQHDPEAN